MITKEKRNKTKKAKDQQREKIDRFKGPFNTVANSGRPKRCSIRDIKFVRV